MTAQAIYHVLPYATWAAGGRTDCCGRPVTDLPQTDACGPDQRGREVGQQRCYGNGTHVVDVLAESTATRRTKERHDEETDA
jgi:hypothetical protein